MKHAGKARQAGLKILLWTLLFLACLFVGGFLAVAVGSIITAGATTLVVLWGLFALFVLNFFRDPNPRTPRDPEAIVAPAHGKVDVIDETAEPEFMGGPCRRVSIFLSVMDVHIQYAPAAGEIGFLRHYPGQFLNAMRSDCGMHNENVLYGLESASLPGGKAAVRLIAGLLARRIVPWVAVGDRVEKGERTSLIQFGSRVDIYLPLGTRIAVELGQRVKGGETVIATCN